MNFEQKNLIKKQLAEVQQLLSRVAVHLSESEYVEDDYKFPLWLTVTQASIILECAVGTVSHKVNKGVLMSNGMTRKQRRVYAPSLISDLLKRKTMTTEDESDEDVERLFDELDSENGSW